MKAKSQVPFYDDPPAPILAELEVRTIGKDERQRVDQFLKDQHYLGPVRSIGRTLIQVVHHRERWVALLVWGPAMLKLSDRDEWIGWTHTQRSERINLVVQNRRFLVLGPKRLPNLASRCLGLALKALPEAWQQSHGYRPLLVETFTDIEQFEGTCYKAAGWEPCGITHGVIREHRADFYFANQRPKKLWIKPLQKNTRQLLQSMDMPADYQAAINPQSPERVLPLKKSQIESLQDALRQVPDPRAANRVFSLSSLLILVAIGLLAGRKHLAQIQRFGQFLTDRQRGWLGWPRTKGSTRRRAPSYSALYNLLTQLDADALAQTLSQWLQKHHGTLPRALAIDGKYVRDVVLTLCLSEHETGAPVSIALAAPAPCTPEAKKEGELNAARRLYPQTQLEGALVTADALHCERKTARIIVEAGGDFLLQLKDNQPNALKQAQGIASTHTPLLPATRPIQGTDDSTNVG